VLARPILFTLPAGALADMVDRKWLLCVTNLWLAAAAAGLAIVGSLHLFNPGIILVSVFLIGVGFAFNAPTWISIVPHIVSDAELPAAVTLSGLQLNISGIIGPALGWSVNPVDRGEFCVCSQCRLLPRCDSGNPAVEASSERNQSFRWSAFSNRSSQRSATPVTHQSRRLFWLANGLVCSVHFIHALELKLLGNLPIVEKTYPPKRRRKRRRRAA
jgi:MFS family permease